MTAAHDLQALAATLGATHAEPSSDYARQYAIGTSVAAPASALFDFLDVRARGGSIGPTTARATGDLTAYRRPSRAVLDRHFDADEIVTAYEPGRLKAWESMGRQHFLLGRYRKGFRIENRGDRSGLTVFIGYALPSGWLRRAIAARFAARYAKWTARRIVDAALAWAATQQTQLQPATA